LLIRRHAHLLVEVIREPLDFDVLVADPGRQFTKKAYPAGSGDAKCGDGCGLAL
jgi:hypothetical protein